MLNRCIGKIISCSPLEKQKGNGGKGGLAVSALTSVVVFSWTSLLCKMLTMDNLRKHKLVVVNTC